MSDVASILGIKAPAATAEETMKSIIDGPKKQTTKPKVVKPAGMAREVFQLVGQNSIAPSVQPSKVTPAYKTKRTNAAKGKWIWTSFHNSARSDNKEFYHWQRADIQFNDYPFAKFNIKMDSIRYTDDEYNSFLTNTKWSRSETDYLMYICHRYDLRWPVIADRYDFVPTRPLAEIQERYFEVSSKLNTKRTANANGSNTNSQSSHVSVKDSNGIRDKEIVFDVNYEKDRKHQQDHLFKQ